MEKSVVGVSSAGLIVLLLCGLPVKASEVTLSPTPIGPRIRVIQPFGYGPVNQFLVKAVAGTGLQQCQSVNGALKCLSVSGGNSCSATAPVGELVSCGPPKPIPVNESLFQPVSCYGQASGDGGHSGLLNSDDYCLADNYMPQRNADTLYLYDDYVRFGINRRFGGAVFELYGNDKLDRVLQNAGGGLQLSLWAFVEQYASASYARGYYPVSSTATSSWMTSFGTVGYQTNAQCVSSNPGLACGYGVEGPNLISSNSGIFPCADNGAAANAPLNPLQASSTGCIGGSLAFAVDSVTSPSSGVITVTKSNPANFTRSDVYSGLTWQETAQVVGPYALVTYKMAGAGTVDDSSFQEIPALILHDGMNAFAYYYTGAKPYNDVSGQVSRLAMASGEQEQLQFPGRPGPFGVGSSANLTEDWISTCDATETRCLTIASFSPSAQDLIITNPPTAPYFGIHGFFSLTNQLNRTVTIAIFPYRFDDVIEGMTVRQWVYQLRQMSNVGHSQRQIDRSMRNSGTVDETFGELTR